MTSSRDSAADCWLAASICSAGVFAFIIRDERQQPRSEHVAKIGDEQVERRFLVGSQGRSRR